MEGKTVSLTRVTTYHETLPGESNNEGKFFGGSLMRLMDSVGYYPAVRHARGRLVTAALGMSFLAPVELGHILICHASVNAVWSTSMEVGVRVETEDPFTGEIKHVASAYITFVSLDENRKPVPIPPLILENDEDRRRFAEATRRAASSRLEQKGDPEAMGMLHLKLLPGNYAVYRLRKDEPLPDLSCLDGTSFVNLCRTQDELSLIVDEEAAGKLCSIIPSIDDTRCCYVCLQVDEKDIINKVGMLASLSTLLASVQVPLVTVSTYQTFCVLIEKIYLEKVIERLTTAGHTVDRSSHP